MKKITLVKQFLASLFLFISFFSFAVIAQAQCNTVAYSGAASNGNQNYPERLGGNFTVNSPITVTALGVFDDGQNGLATAIQVGIVRNSDGATVAGPISISGALDPLEVKHRMHVITPVTLPAGDYIVVAVGFNDVDLNGNSTIGSYPTTETNTGGGLISFTGSSFVGVGFGKPTMSFDIPNAFHAGTFKFSPASPDTDGDGIGDACDTDDDNDGILDINDNCPLIANANQADNDHDGIGDACDPDDDNDGVPDAIDNCPLVANPNQADANHNGIGDVCEVVQDQDNDGVPDAIDNCPSVANPNQADNDHDGIGDVCDPDDDNDGVPDVKDNCPFTANPFQLDIDHDGIGDACDPDIDNDGVLNTKDNCPYIANPNQADLDQDGKGDACDLDIDGDGVPNLVDCAPLDKTNNKWMVCHKGQTLCIPQSAVLSHLLHGDYPGACINCSRAPKGKVTEEEEMALPEKLTLTNFPNPFTNATTIVYQLPFDCKVSLKVYDMMGRVVTTLVNGEKKAGNYKADFDASKFGAGTFFYRIDAVVNGRQISQTASMVRLK